MHKLLGSLAFLLCTPLCGWAQSARIQDVAWLRGCWTMTNGDRVIEEQWMAPAGKAMLGVGRTVRGESLIEYEFVVLREQGDRLEYVAQPSGQPAASFLLREVGDRQVVFENPQHDFPQRILYRALPGDKLHARIEGMRNGSLRGVDFPMKRSACAEGAR